MNNKYLDIPSTIQVIGCIYLKPSILDNTEKYVFNESDFPVEFHRILFGSIYNLYTLGVEKIDINTIEDYLRGKPNKYAVYQNNRGSEYLEKIKDTCQISAFDYYYNRMKKMTLFRNFLNIGLDLKWLYNSEDISSPKKRQEQDEWLDNTSIDEINEIIDKKITEVKIQSNGNINITDIIKAGDEAEIIIDELIKIPEIGVPLYGKLINGITRGARLKKLFLVSAPSGVMKTRYMVSNACYIGCDEIYNKYTGKWEKNGIAEPSLFITTEQEKSEIITMMLAFLSGVNEKFILDGNYQSKSDEERVRYAAKILNRCPVYIKELPDFTIKDIENLIKFSVMEHKIKYIFHDYVHSSLKILSEISSKTKIQNMREDQILLMLMIILKDLCNKYGIFIMTGSQLNGGQKLPIKSYPRTR